MVPCRLALSESLVTTAQFARETSGYEVIKVALTQEFPWRLKVASDEPWISGKAWQGKDPLTRVLVIGHPNVAHRACH